MPKSPSAKLNKKSIVNASSNHAFRRASEYLTGDLKLGSGF